jgi:nucleotide-binding universal stress UspA family protein
MADYADPPASEVKPPAAPPPDPAALDRARAFSRRWGERLDSFTLPCPLCHGQLEFHGMLHDQLYEFAEGEPGVVEPQAIYPLTFVCNRCGYAAEFDAELFNPAYLATLAGAQPEQVHELSLRDYRVVVPLHSHERGDTALDLATAVVGGGGGDVVVIDTSPTEAEGELLANKLEAYRPARGDPAPVRVVRKGARHFGDVVVEQRANLLLMSVHGQTRADESSLVGFLRRVLSETSTDVVLVYDRGLPTVNRILFATSGGPSARAAAPFAVSVARAFEADLHLLYIAAPEVSNPQEVGHQHIAVTLSEVESTEGLALQRRVQTDRNPTAAIVAESSNYDLLIIGGSPEGWQERLRLDTTSTKIARNSDATTLVMLSRASQPRPWWRRLLG